MKETDIAWLAGLLEGEGCFTFCANAARLILNMSDLDIVERAKEIMDSKDVIYRSMVGRTGKQMYCTEITSSEKLREVLTAIYPYMGKRRKARIDELLKYTEGVLERKADREQKALLIRHLYATGKFYQRELAEMAGLCLTTINNYVNRKTMRHI